MTPSREITVSVDLSSLEFNVNSTVTGYTEQQVVTSAIIQGEKGDPGEGIPSGGSDDQVLAKSTDSLSGTKWQTLGSAAYEEAAAINTAISAQTGFGGVSNYVTQVGKLFEDFENTSDWTVGAGSISADTIHFKTGTKGLNISITDGGGFATKTISQAFTHPIGFWAYISDSTKFSSFKISFSSVNNFAKYFERRISIDTVRNGWNFITLSESDWTNVGGESWSNTMIRMRFRIDSYAGMTANITFDSLYYDMKARPKLLIEFDDGWLSAYTTAFPYMQSKGFKGTMGIIAGRINTPGFLTDAQAKDLYDAGWDLVTHGESDMTTLANQAAMIADIQLNQDYMVSRNLTRNAAYKHYTYPQGKYNDTVLAAIEQSGTLSARTIISENQSTSLGVDNFRLLRAKELRSDTTTLVMAKGWIDNCIERGETLILFGHKVVSSPSSFLDWATADFEELMDYIQTYVDAGELDVITRSEWYNGLGSGNAQTLDKSYVDTSLAGYVKKDGDTMSGNLGVSSGTTITPATSSTYALQIKNSVPSTQAVALGSSSTSAYLQSFGVVPLQINGQGNDVHIGANQGTGKLGITTTNPTNSVTVSASGNGIAIYNSADQVTNREYLLINFASDVATIKTEFSGSGAGRDMSIGSNSSTIRMRYLQSADGSYESPRGLSTANVVHTKISGTMTQSSGLVTLFSINPNINQTGTGGYRIFYTNVTQTATGTGLKLLAEWQVDGATKFRVASDGSSTQAGGVSLPTSTITSTVTLTSTNYTLLADATSGSITVNLPAAASNPGRVYVIKKIDSSVNTVTIDANASETIDGTTTKVISTQYASLTIHCDGTQWWII